MKPHPLFPQQNEDANPPEVGYIHVTRHGPGGQSWAPQRWDAAELTELAQIQEWFGGGMYELIARDHDNRKITARVRYRLEGPSKPLDPGAKDAPPEPVAVPQLAPATGGGGMSEQVLMAVMGMMQQQMAQQTQMVVAMLTKGDQSSEKFLQAMAQLHANASTGQTQLLGKMFEAMSGGGGGGGGGVDGFLKGVEYASELQAGIREAQGEDDNDNSLEQIMEGVKVFAQMGAQERATELERMRIEQAQREARERELAAERARQEQSAAGPPPANGKPNAQPVSIPTSAERTAGKTRPS